RNFQYEFGLDVDGLAGSGTKEKLVKASQYVKQFVKEQIRESNDFNYYGGMDNNQQTTETEDDQDTTSSTITATDDIQQCDTQNDITLMANAVHGEARGEPYVGKVAVAAVILNRVESSTFPNTISGVIFEPRAFTAVSDGQIWLTPDESARKA